MLPLWLGSTLVACVVLAAPVMTCVGARRRGRGVPAALLAGIFFPVTWVAWYVRDEHPYAGRGPRVDRQVTPSA
jgi:hypothetical protein